MQECLFSDLKSSQLQALRPDGPDVVNLRCGVRGPWSFVVRVLGLFDNIHQITGML